MKGYSLVDLPARAQEKVLKSYFLKNSSKYRSSQFEATRYASDLFSAFTLTEAVTAKVGVGTLVWATDAYGKKAVSKVQPRDFPLIVPRVEKEKAEQKRRTKEKAEVFTPAWVCNAQNSLIDDAVLYAGAFNEVDIAGKTWRANPSPIQFTEDYTWAHYVTERRLEMCAGEGPYLMSRYDPTTGDFIPVKDEAGTFQRIGLLDRKLRVVSENTGVDLWVTAALSALRATYGYEWQGDNLLLARLNFINTFVDYYKDYFSELPSEELLEEVAEISSWNLWQMDGLKMVVPNSCSNTCQSCTKKARTGHDGVVSIIKFGERVLPFEDLLTTADSKVKTSA